ncbi:MAG: D-glycero-beta-D-manno-heptose 1-phosphate adenylyltransferase [Nanoarchaeota archaeon]|nr:D-glycero-beta-D-manno-heptose 1-phosphate adenylyltransferase [Nanoarchaeota archaeon]|tara:strand:+ start:115 stop:591 length:477 start_codon:yes stop_codon:yes gene_type:complete
MGSIQTKESMKSILKILRKEAPIIKVVTTNGAFDILHSGHVFSLKKAKSYGDILIVCLNSDSSIKKYKSLNRPIIPQKDRAELLVALEIVDYVVIFNETDPREILKIIKPNFHVKSKSGFKGIEKDVVEKNGGKIVLIDDTKEGYSTTKIIEKIKLTN